MIDNSQGTAAEAWTVGRREGEVTIAKRETAATREKAAEDSAADEMNSRRTRGRGAQREEVADDQRAVEEANALAGEGGGKDRVIAGSKKRGRGVGGGASGDEAEGVDLRKLGRDRGRFARRRGGEGVGAKGFQEEHNIVAQGEWNAEVQAARGHRGKGGSKRESFNAIL